MDNGGSRTDGINYPRLDARPLRRIHEISTDRPGSPRDWLLAGKAVTTPEQYPLSVNGVVTACNRKRTVNRS